MDAWTKWFINSCTLITFAGYPTDEVCTPSVAQFSRFRIVKLIYLRRSKMINLYDFRFNRLFISLLSTFYLFHLIQTTFSQLPGDCCSIPAAWNTVSELCIHFCNLQCIEKNVSIIYFCISGLTLAQISSFWIVKMIYLRRINMIGSTYLYNLFMIAAFPYRLRWGWVYPCPSMWSYRQISRTVCVNAWSNDTWTEHFPSIFTSMEEITIWCKFLDGKNWNLTILKRIV